MSRTVSIIQTRLTHYRVPLFQKLRESLANYGINMNLIHGFATGSEAKKEDAGHLEWGIQIKNLSFQLLGTEIVWQPALKFLKDSDLIIVSQENRILLNYLLLIRKIFDHQKLRFGGTAGTFKIVIHETPKNWLNGFFLLNLIGGLPIQTSQKRILLDSELPGFEDYCVGQRKRYKQTKNFRGVNYR